MSLWKNHIKLVCHRSLDMSEMALSSEVSARIAAFLKEKHPRNTAKLVAREAGVVEVTAAKWLEGHLPQSSHLLRLMKVNGPVFTCFVLSALGDWASVLHQRARLDAVIAESRALLQELEGPVVTTVRRVAATLLINLAILVGWTGVPSILAAEAINRFARFIMPRRRGLT